MDIAQARRLMQQQRFAEAIAALEQALAGTPGDIELRLLLAEAAFRSGNTGLARAQLEEAVRRAPAHAPAAFHLGVVAQLAGDAVAAERCYRSAIEHQPDHADALYNLALMLRSAGRHVEALAFLQRARTAAPRRSDIALMLAWSCIDNGANEDAIASANAAIGLQPDDASGWHVMGLAWRYLGAYKTARKTLLRAATLASERAEIAHDLAVTLMEAGEYEAALTQFAHARRLAPLNGEYRWRDFLATCMFPGDTAQALHACARFADGVERIDAALASGDAALWEVAFACASGITPFYLHYQSIDTVATTRRFGELVARVANRTCAETCAPLDRKAHGGRIRVGFVCSALREHTLTRYFSGWMLGLDRKRFEVSAWNLSALTDEVTARIETHVEHFHQAGALDVRELGASIRAQHLDAIIHLDVGMDGRTQMLAAMRLAPVQCASYGHPVTTGLPGIDYFLSGAAMEPANADLHYSERLVRLPGLGVVPQRPPPPDDGSWLQREHGRPLLLCVQNVIKLTPQFDDIVARVAAATRARIVFFESAGILSDLLRARLGTAFSAHGLVLDDHVRIEKKRGYESYLGAIAKADLVIDSTHFSGGRSSLDALSVGTPVLTLEGEWMRGRQTAAMLRILGADELIVGDADGYVATAAALSADADRRDRLRRRILANVWKLFDADDVIPALEAFLERATAGTVGD